MMLLTNKEELQTFVQDFDFAFCRSRRPLSIAIRIFTRGKWSHIAHFRKDTEGNIYVVDAQRNGYEPKSLEEWLKKYKYDFVAIRSKNVDKNVMIAREQSILGLNYDFLGLGRHAFKNIAELLNKVRAQKIPTWIDLSQRFEDRRLYCSEAELKMIGLNLQLDPNESYPVFIQEGYEPAFEYKQK